jgi:hypothetical protein
MRFGLREPQQAAAMMRFFPHATDPAAPVNAGVRGDVAAGLNHAASGPRRKLARSRLSSALSWRV